MCNKIAYANQRGTSPNLIAEQYTKPLSCPKSLIMEYGHFLIGRFIIPHFLKGSTKVHMLLDNLEQMKDDLRVLSKLRDISLSTDYLCWVFFSEAEISSKWIFDFNFCTWCKGIGTKDIHHHYYMTIDNKGVLG